MSSEVRLKRIPASLFGLLSLVATAESRAQPPAATAAAPSAELPAAVTNPVPVGYRKLQFTYSVTDRPARTRDYFLWYPTSDRESRYDYKGQFGVAAPDGAIAPGRHPLIVFSHGFLGAGDQIIFLTESLARAGYIVAA